MTADATRNSRLEVRVSAVERRTAEKAAKQKKIPLSEWIRNAVRAQAEKDLEAVPWASGGAV